MALKSKNKIKKPKKPYHIKREDLHLEEYKEYKEYIEERDRIRFSDLMRPLYRSVQFRIYIGLQLVASFIGFGRLMLLIGFFWTMHPMLTDRSVREMMEKSAYSLFINGVEA